MASKLECPVCSENFKNPRVLPCGHSYCEECFESWLKSSTSKQQLMSDRNLGQAQKRARSPHKLPCPECCEEHTVPAQGVKGFKTNFALARASGDTQECENCTIGREAITKCLDCDRWLCSKCCDLHKQGLAKKHEIVSIQEANSKKTVDPEKPSKYKKLAKNDKFSKKKAPSLRLVKTINVKTSEDRKQCLVWDVTFLNDGNIAVIDCSAGNAKIKIFTIEGELVLQSKKGLFLNPHDVSALPGDRDHLLVIDMKKHKVLSWNLRNQKVMEFVTSGVRAMVEPRGLSTTRSGIQDIVLVGDQGAGAVFKVSTNGHVLQQVRLGDFLGYNICYTAGHPECQEVTVSSPTMGISSVRNCKPLWRIKKNLQSPRGVVLTRTGEVLVSDMFCHRVTLVSREGQMMNTLLSAEDGLNKPTGLAYSEHHHLLAVVEWDSQLLKLYHY